MPNEETNENLMDKIYDSTTLKDKLDFNPELLNTYFLKIINSYLDARYMKETDKYKKYLTSYCQQVLSDDIIKDKKRYEFSEQKIKIKDIKLISQNMKSINYISEITLDINVEIKYFKKNIFTNSIRETKEKYNQELLLIYCDNGWYLEKYYNRNYYFFNDDTIIKL